MIGQHRHHGMIGPDRAPVRLEMELAVGMAEAVEEMRLLEGQRAIVPAPLPRRSSASGSPETRSVSSMISHSRHREAAMLRAQPARQLADHVMVGARLAIGLDHLAGDLEWVWPLAGVDVVMLEEGRGRQHDIGHRRRLGHELLVDADEEIVAGEASRTLFGVRADHHRVGVLDQHRRHRRPVAEIAASPVSTGPMRDWSSIADRRVEHVEPLDQRAVERIEPAIAVERAAAAMLPGAGHRRQAGDRVQLRRTVARAGEAVADADEAALGAAIEPGEIDDRRRGTGR